MTTRDLIIYFDFTGEFANLLQRELQNPENYDFFPPFADEKFLAEYLPWSKCDKESTKYFEPLRDRLNNDPYLRIFANFLFDGYFKKNFFNELAAKAQSLRKVLTCELQGALTLMLGISSFPLIAESYKAKGIPLEYAQNIASWISGGVATHRAGNNDIAGVRFQQMSWMRHAVNCRNFRIGRFEYLLHTPVDDLPAIFRNKNSGEIVALGKNFWCIDKHGYRLNEYQNEGEKITLSYDKQQVTGFYIEPVMGRCLIDKRITLDLNEWQGYGLQHEIVPSIHIPSGGNMNMEAMKSSLEEAVKFFKKYFNLEIQMFSCVSWILSPDWLEEIPNSNMVKFMRELYLIPSRYDEKAGLIFIFGREDKDFSSYPADNSMRQAFHNLFKRNETLKWGAGFIMTDDIKNFGKQTYQQQNKIDKNIK